MENVRVRRGPTCKLHHLLIFLIRTSTDSYVLYSGEQCEEAASQTHGSKKQTILSNVG